VAAGCLAETGAVLCCVLYRRTLGAQHGDTILAVIDLRQFWITEKKFAQAEALLHQELKGLGDAEVADSMVRFRMMTMLGYTAAAQQRWAAAAPLLKNGYEGMLGTPAWRKIRKT